MSGFNVTMFNSTTPAPTLSSSFTTPVPPTLFSSFTKLEKLLICAIGIIVIIFILQSICFVVYIIKVKSKRRRNRERSLISNVREPLSNEENDTERYSSRPLKQVSDPQIYESLKDVTPDTAPPLPPIATLPKRKPLENVQSLDTLGRDDDAEDKELFNSMARRPRLPLPNESGALQLPPKNNVFATMPRMPIFKPVPTPHISSTLNRYPHNDSPHPNKRYVGLPINNQIPPPRPHPPAMPPSSLQVPNISPLEVRTLPKPRIPKEIQNKTTLPFEKNHEISVDGELWQKLKKRAQRIPSLSNDIPVQVTNGPTRIQPPPVKREPYVQDELMQKLKKRAALIPDSRHQPQTQKQTNRIHTPTTKPLPPTPRHSDYEDGWEDNFDSIEPLENIHMYNI